MFYETTTAVISIALVLWVYFGPLSRLRREQFRSDIRLIRDDLFDFVWKHGFSHDDLAYQECRASLNAVLRGSNFLSPAFFVLIALKSPREPTIHTKSKHRALQAKIDDARARMADRTVWFVFAEGIVGWCLWLLVLGLRAARVVKSTSQVVAQSISGLESIARVEAAQSRYCLPHA